MNTSLVNTVADAICRAQKNGTVTATGLAIALDGMCLLQSPETARELKRLRSRVNELEAAVSAAFAGHQRHPDSEHCQHDGAVWPCPTVATLAPTRQVPAEVSADRWTRFLAPTQVLTIEADDSPSTPPRYGICTRPGCEHLGMFHGIDVCRTHMQKDGEPVRYCDCAGFVTETGGAS
ncbi:hypothetical protein [Streptomyces sp. bgisy031]|uniref:hypothetical protein n=1 Tax=Streptomyces sp. bgisy031 TaxID=3413772 RepID=UPI003D70FD16